MSTTATVISHFYNEEYLLPWWLEHHTRLFHHGILINRGSTDRSVEICQKLAPHWEIRQSRNMLFDPIDADQEVMEIEMEIKGWKMALNTTEFLCCPDMNMFLATLESYGQDMYWISGISMIDDPNYGYKDPIYDLPLVTQRHHGLLDGEKTVNIGLRGRFIHKHPHGAYLPGRHQTYHRFMHFPPEAFIKWFGFSPWNNETRKRKLQIRATVSPNVTPGFGGEHLIDSSSLESWYVELAKLTKDLRLRPEYRRIMGPVQPLGTEGD